MSSVLLDLNIPISKMEKYQKSAWEFCAQVTHGKENSQVSGCSSLKTMALHPFSPSPCPFSSSSLPVGRHVHDRPSWSSPLLTSFPLHHHCPPPLSGLPFTDPYPGGLTIPGKPQKSKSSSQRLVSIQKEEARGA